jgi:hypothetical protein
MSSIISLVSQKFDDSVMKGGMLVGSLAKRDFGLFDYKGKVSMGF